jgi:DNA-binding MarR family transcriptional regulator
VVTRVPQLELDNQLCFALYSASRALIRAYGPFLGSLGLTYPQYITMLALWEAEGSVSVGSLGSRLQLDSGTLTPLLKRLEQLGLIERRRDPGDERRVMITLTAEGSDLQAAAAPIPECMQHRLGIDLEAARALRASLMELTANLERGIAPPAGVRPGAARAANAGSADR